MGDQVEMLCLITLFSNVDADSTKHGPSRNSL